MQSISFPIKEFLNKKSFLTIIGKDITFMIHLQVNNI